MSEQINEETLKRSLSEQNVHLKNTLQTVKQIACKKMKSKYMTIVELDPLSFEEIMKNKTVLINWDVCRVFEYFNIKRCFGCKGFNHESNNCREQEMCCNCGDTSHNEGECKNDTRCVNCLRANKINLSEENKQIKDITTYDVQHSPYDYEKCSILKQQIEACKRQTVYQY